MPAELLAQKEQQSSYPNSRKEREDFDQRWSQMETEFSSWKSHWQELSTYILPRNGRFMDNERASRGQRKHNAIFDNTGTRSVRVVGSGLMAGATSPAR